MPIGKSREVSVLYTWRMACCCCVGEEIKSPHRTCSTQAPSRRWSKCSLFANREPARALKQGFGTRICCWRLSLILMSCYWHLRPALGPLRRAIAGVFLSGAADKEKPAHRPPPTRKGSERSLAEHQILVGDVQPFWKKEKSWSLPKGMMTGIGIELLI